MKFDLTIVMPCRNKADTSAECIRKARLGLPARVHRRLAAGREPALDGAAALAGICDLRHVHQRRLEHHPFGSGNYTGALAGSERITGERYLYPAIDVMVCGGLRSAGQRCAGQTRSAA